MTDEAFVAAHFYLLSEPASVEMNMRSVIQHIAKPIGEAHNK